MASNHLDRAPTRLGKNLRVFLKYVDRKHKTNKTDIFETVHIKLKGCLTGLRETTNGFNAYTDLDATVDALTSVKGLSEFRRLNLEPQVPPEIKARRTVFVRGLDSSVGSQTVGDITDELVKNHDWIKYVLATKIKDYTHVIKLTFGSTDETDRALRDGLLAFSCRIPPSNITIEKFTSIQICFKCYKYEDHSTFQCTSTEIVCSECASSGHYHKDCKSLEKRCLNCPPNNNSHRTLAPSCPVKKQAIRAKEERDQSKKDTANNKTYSNIVKSTLLQTKPEPRPIINISDKTQLKLVVLIIEAHVTALTEERPYNEILTESLRLNYDVDVKLPNRDSQKILDLYYKPTTNRQQEKTKEQTDKRMETDEIQSPDKEPMFMTQTKQRQRLDSESTASHAPTPFPSPVKGFTDKQNYQYPGRSRSSSLGMDQRQGRKRTKDSPTDQKDSKQKDNKRQDTGQKQKSGRYSLKLYRNKDDKDPIPEYLTSEWLTSEIFDKVDEGGGVKVYVTGDCELFLTHLQNNCVVPTRSQIQLLDKKEFDKLKRVTRRDK